MSKAYKLLKDVDKHANQIETFVSKQHVQLDFESKKDFSGILQLIETFIHQQKLLIYGGTALNIVVPDELKFYNQKHFPDYDCLSYKPVKHAQELCAILYENGNKYVYAKRAINPGTITVYVNFKRLVDISHVSKDLYKHMCKQAKHDYAHMKIPLPIVPLDFLLYAIHHELGRPLLSVHRWSKVYKRLVYLYQSPLLQKYMQCDALQPHNSAYKNIVDVIIEYARYLKHPICGNYAALYYMDYAHPEKYCLNQNDALLGLLSINANETAKSLTKLLKQRFSDVTFAKYYIKSNSNMITYTSADDHIHTPILPSAYEIYGVFENNQKALLVSIYDTHTECLSYQYMANTPTPIVTIDTLMRFYHAYMLVNPSDIVRSIICSLTNKLIKEFNVEQRFSVHCYGSDYNPYKIQKSRWDKGIDSIVYLPK